MTLIEAARRKATLPESMAAQAELKNLTATRGLETPMFLFGANVESERWLSQLNVEGIIDDFAPLPSRFHGVPLVRASDVPVGSLVVNCVTNSKSVTALKRVQSIAGVHGFNGSDLAAVYPALPLYSFVEESRAVIFDEEKRWEQLYLEFIDDESRVALEDVLAYRLTGDPRTLLEYTYRPEEQYFEEFLTLNEEVFLDGGAYDGETSMLFASLYPDYRGIHAFEPDPENYELTLSKLKNLPRTSCHPVGVSDEVGELKFSIGLGSASVVSDEGSIVLQVEKIDNVAADATFIKLDLEGWELNALKGAEKTIIKNKPKLALCVYHEPQHFLTYHDWVKNLRDDYRVALRHYTQGWAETVMYFF